MAPGLDQLLLAVITGAMFGYIVSLLGSSPQRLAVLLVALWALQTLAQQIYRAIDEGRDATNEVVLVSLLRLAFAISAVAVVWFAERRLR